MSGAPATAGSWEGMSSMREGARIGECVFGRVGTGLEAGGVNA